MTGLLASLALALATTQHAAEPAPPPGGAAAAPAAEHGAAPGEHGAAPAHGGGHEETLSDVMLHHVSDGYELEYPGVCEGGFSWKCETDLREVFGSALRFGSLDLTPSRHAIMMWLASALLLLAFLLSARKRAMVPKGLYNFLEMLVQFVRDEIAVKNIGARDADRFTPYLCTAFFFILFVNLFGLIPWAATATGNISVTVCLAAFTFLITQWAAIRAQGVGGYLYHLTGGVPWPLWPIMIPVEVLGLFTKPFALTIRLFANMIAGHIVILSLLGLIFALNSPFVAIGSVPMAIAIFLLEIFVGFVQAYIFTMLSSLFIGQGLAHHDAHGDEGGATPGMGHGPDHASHAAHVAGTAPGHG
jgi:F-type H+-transporting ATPase subunit a